MKTTEKFILGVLVLYFVGMMFILYNDIVWKPRATSEIYQTRFTDSELELESAPDYLMWARPTEEARPKNWNVLYGDSEWCWAWKNDETGEWQLSKSYISPRIKDHDGEQ